jgi:hypothetical protein
MKLPTELTELYWSMDDYCLNDPRRMAIVIHKIAMIIRTWAPDPGQAKICHMAINEIADRLMRECTIPPEDNENPD